MGVVDEKELSSAMRHSPTRGRGSTDARQRLVVRVAGSIEARLVLQVPSVDWVGYLRENSLTLETGWLVGRHTALAAKVV